MDTPLSILQQKHNMREFEIEQQEKREDDMEKEKLLEETENEINKIKEEPEYQVFCSDENGNGCPICLLPFCNIELSDNQFRGYHSTNAYDNIPIKIKTCGHMFHYDCLKKYCNATPGNTRRICKCPLCRAEFNFNISTEKLFICEQFANKLSAILIKYRKIYEERQRVKRQERLLQKMLRERENREKEQELKLKTLREKYDYEKRQKLKEMREKDEYDEYEKRQRLKDMQKPLLEEEDRISRARQSTGFEREYLTGFSNRGGKKKSKNQRKKTNNKKNNKMRRKTKKNLKM